GAGEAGRVVLGRNFHVVVPGQIYRCAQLNGATLERFIQAHGIRTVVNLRGFSPDFPWYCRECRVTHRLDVNQEDIAFSAARLPAVGEVRRLIEVLAHTEYPILLHCRQGAARTGLAAVIALLLHTDATLDAARRHLGLRYGHFAVGRTAHLDRFIDLYADWLRDHEWGHSRQTFRQWVEEAYCPGECRCEFEPLELPALIPRGAPTRIRLRVHNRSLKPWRLRPENHVGVHLAFLLKDAQDRSVMSGRAGLFDAQVDPGQSIDLTLALPAVTQTGRYRLLVGMVDERHCWFYQTGSEPLERALEAQD